MVLPNGKQVRACGLDTPLSKSAGFFEHSPSFQVLGNFKIVRGILWPSVDVSSLQSSHNLFRLTLSSADLGDLRHPLGVFIGELIDALVVGGCFIEAHEALFKSCTGGVEVRAVGTDCDCLGVDVDGGEPKSAPKAAAILSVFLALNLGGIRQDVPRARELAESSVRSNDPFTIRQLPEAFKPTSPGGFMNPPGLYDKDPEGFFFIPTYNPKSGNFYIRAAIEDPRPILGHEGIPGHHFQISLAQENTSLPSFQRFDGNNRYVLHFDKGKSPPAEAFWSLTMYNEKQLLVANPLERYSIGDRDKPHPNPDGSLDIYVQHDSPGKDKESNWLPAPKENFTVILRIYSPKAELLERRWEPPAIKLSASPKT